MILRSDRELQNTRRKLHLLEEEYDLIVRESGGDEEARALELQSLKGLINQFKEDVARFEAHRSCTPEPDAAP